MRVRISFLRSLTMPRGALLARGAPALKIEGGEYQFFFENCMFEGQAKGDGTNVFIGGGPGPGTPGYPYIINFRGLTSERAGTGVQIDGGANIEFEMSHHELLDGAYLVTYGANNAKVPTDGLVIANSSFNGNVGVNSGQGYIVNVSSSHATGVVVRSNMIYGNPDHFIQAVDHAQVISEDNDFPQLKANLPPSSGVTTQITPAATINIGGVHSVGLKSIRRRDHHHSGNARPRRVCYVVPNQWCGKFQYWGESRVRRLKQGETRSPGFRDVRTQ